MVRLKILTLISIFITLLFVSCEKQLFDYRNKYLGSWKFDISLSREWYDPIRSWHDSTNTISSNGEIKYGSKENRVLIQTPSYSVEIAIDKNGTVIPENDFGMDYSESGKFEGRRVFEYHYYHHWGGSQEYRKTDITGKRN